MIRVRMTIGRIFRNLLILLTLFTAVLSLSDTSTNGQVKLDYSVIQATGKFCTGRDSCQLTGRQNRGPEGIENDWKKRNCFCDDEVRPSYFFNDIFVLLPPYITNFLKQFF
jgi:hypothetical protein